jgi:hypothetical protein
MAALRSAYPLGRRAYVAGGDFAAVQPVGENLVDFAHGGFKAASSAVKLPIAITTWDWVGPVMIATLGAGFWGWLWAAESKQQSLWAAIKS